MKSFRRLKLKHLYKLAAPRDEGSLFDVHDYGTQFDEDFYPDLEKDVISLEKKFNNIYHERSINWVGTAGEMVRADIDYVWPIQGNIFYPEKISQLTNKIKSSEGKVTLYAPYGEMSKITLDDIEESLKYEDDYHHASLTTGDEELDEYLKDKDQYIDDNSIWDEDLESDGDDLRKDLEERLRAAEESGDGDFGEFSYQIRDGNHRVFAAKNAGEKYVWIKISNNQLQDIREGAPWLAGYKERLK